MKTRSILFLDNYDSFSHNVVHALSVAGASCTVVKNDAHDATWLLEQPVDAYVISAGPCTPSRAGSSLALIERLGREKPETPLLGICLGHQAIAVNAGARLRRATEPMHGKLTPVTHDRTGVLAAMPSPFMVARYNSLVVDEANLPTSIVVTARDNHGDIMAIRHVGRPHVGVQFHPESWLCPRATAIFTTWLGA